MTNDALNKRKRSSFESDSDSESSSSDSENEIMNFDSSKAVSDDESEEELDFSSLIVISQSELDMMEQKVLSNPIGFHQDWLSIIQQYQYRCHHLKSNQNSSNRKNIDIPKTYSSMCTITSDSGTSKTIYINVSAMEKLRQVRWAMSENFVLGKKLWIEWVKDEEAWLDEVLYSKMIQSVGVSSTGSDESDRGIALVKFIYERCLLWENACKYDFKCINLFLDPEICLRYCNFMMKHFEDDDENSNLLIENSFNCVLELLGSNNYETIFELYISYLKRRIDAAQEAESKQHLKTKLREVFKRQLSIPKNAVMTAWKKYTSFEEEEMDASVEPFILEMKSIYTKSLKEIEERIAVESRLNEGKGNRESIFLDFIYLEKVKYYESKERGEDVGTQYQRVLSVLKRGVTDCPTSETLWNKFMEFVIGEKSVQRDFVANSMIEKNLKSLIQTNYQYLSTSVLEQFLNHICSNHQVDANLVRNCLIVWSSIKNVPWSNSLWRKLFACIEMVFSSVVKKVPDEKFAEIISKYSQAVQDLMYKRALPALNCYANDLGFIDFYQVFSHHCSMLTRLNRIVYYQTIKLTSKGLNSEEVLQKQQEVFTAAEQSFENCVSYLNQYFLEDKAKTSSLELQYADLMLENELIDRAKQVFETYILQSEVHKKELKSWQEYIRFLERLNWAISNPENPLAAKNAAIRSAFADGVKTIEGNAARQNFAKHWIQFEKTYGDDVEDLLTAEHAWEAVKKLELKEKKKTEKKEKQKEVKEKKAKKKEEKVKKEKKEKAPEIEEVKQPIAVTLPTPVEPAKIEEKQAEPPKKKVKIDESHNEEHMQDEVFKDKKEKETKQKESNNVILWNLPYSMEEDKIRSLFEQNGFQPKRVTLVRRENGSSKGIAFIEMTDTATVLSAVEKLNDYKIDDVGHLLKAAEAEITKMKRILHKQKAIRDKPQQSNRSAGRGGRPPYRSGGSDRQSFTQEDRSQKKPAMFKPRAVPPKPVKTNNAPSSSSATNSSSTTATTTESASSTSTPSEKKALTNDDFKKFLL